MQIIPELRCRTSTASNSEHWTASTGRLSLFSELDIYKGRACLMGPSPGPSPIGWPEWTERAIEASMYHFIWLSKWKTKYLFLHSSVFFVGTCTYCVFMKKYYKLLNFRTRGAVEVGDDLIMRMAWSTIKLPLIKYVSISCISCWYLDW